MTADGITWNEVAEFLACSEAYPERPAEVITLETHISRVYLTGTHAYKLKKPLQFDFLDYSTPEVRKAACEAEVALNRRLADDVYVGAVAVVRAPDGSLALGGEGTPVEWVVQMRQLNAGDTFESHLQEGRLTAGHVDLLVERLVRFYRSVPSQRVAPEAYRMEIRRHVEGNERELSRSEHGLERNQVRRILQSQVRLLELAPELFEQRAVSGRVVDGHGDLRPDHIYLEKGAQIIDGIEFSAELRRLDVADELSFLEMECARLKHGSVGASIRQRTLEALMDDPPPALLAFYRSYRACVRAKVAALRAEQQPNEDRQRNIELAREYLELADAETAALPPPLLIVVRGLMGSGKSSLARWLSARLGIEVLSTDRLRQDLFTTGTDHPGFNQGRYSAENRQKVYDAMFARAAERLALKQSVILDGTFLRAAQRTAAARLAADYGATYCLLTCTCPPDVARARIAARSASGSDASEARAEHYDLQVRENEADPPGVAAHAIDSTKSISIMGERVLALLRTTTAL